MNHVSNLDFTGQQIYVGRDVHRKSWSISIFTDQFEHKTFSQPPDDGVLANYLKCNFPGASYKSVYEVGFSSFWIHDRLHQVDPLLLWHSHSGRTGQSRWSKRFINCIESIRMERANRARSYLIEADLQAVLHRG